MCLFYHCIKDDNEKLKLLYYTTMFSVLITLMLALIFWAHPFPHSILFNFLNSISLIIINLSFSNFFRDQQFNKFLAFTQFLIICALIISTSLVIDVPSYIILTTTYTSLLNIALGIFMTISATINHVNCLLVFTENTDDRKNEYSSFNEQKPSTAVISNCQVNHKTLDSIVNNNSCDLPCQTYHAKIY